MFLYAISSFINAFIVLLFTLYIFLKYKKSKVYYFFYLINSVFLFWSVSYGIWQLSLNAESVLFWSRMSSIGAISLALFSFHFIIILIGIEKQQKVALFFAYIQSIIYLIFSSSPLFIRTVEPTFNSLFWPKPGIIYHFYVVFGFLGLMFYSAYLLYDNLKKETGIKKEQIKYTGFVYLLGILIGITNLPYWYNTNIPPYGIFLSFLYPIIFCYILSKYKPSGIDIILGKIFSHVLSFISAVVSGFLLAPYLNELKNFLLTYDFGKFGNLLLAPHLNELKIFLPINIFYILLPIISIFLYKIYYKFYQKIALIIFYSGFDSLQKIVANLSKKLITVLDLEELSNLIIETITISMGSSHVALIFKSIDQRNFEIKKNVGFDENDIIAFINSEDLINNLEQNRTPLLYKELSFLKILRVEKGKRSEIELCLPLFAEYNLIGLIILGKKISEDSYTTQDIELLSTLSNQVSIAIQNAKLYDQVQDLSKNLQRKVDKQTEELRSAYEVEKKAREELEKLDAIKNQFLLATQHHLRTPLTSMRWSADSLLKNKPEIKIKNSIEIIRNSTIRLIKMVNEFLDISQFQLGKEVVNLSPNICIQNILKEIIEELKGEVDSKKIYLKLENLDKNDLIIADESKIKLAIFNVIDNAIKYTNQGGVKINIESNDQFVLITIKDTGIGIASENLNNIFDKVFERGDEAQKTFVTGRGIGLYIAGQIIKAHNGRIWAESEGGGNGSTFFIELPMKL